MVAPSSGHSPNYTDYIDSVLLIQAMHMPSGGYSLSIHRYPILCCGVHVPVVTIYVMVKAACFTSPSRAQPDLLSIQPSLLPG